MAASSQLRHIESSIYNYYICNSQPCLSKTFPTQPFDALSSAIMLVYNVTKYTYKICKKVEGFSIKIKYDERHSEAVMRSKAKWFNPLKNLPVRLSVIMKDSQISMTSIYPCHKSSTNSIFTKPKSED